MTALPAPNALPQNPGEPLDAPLELKQRLVEEINRDRRAAGLAPVEYSSELSHVADEHCREMLRENYTSHWNRAGWKPYLRYAQAGIQDATAENISSVWQTEFPTDREAVWQKMREAHRRFMAEQPPLDGHRRNVLGPWHTRVGIGAAYNREGLRMIEVFGARYAEIESLPRQTTLRAHLVIEGRLLGRDVDVFGVALYYEPLPQPMTREQLAETYAYELPAEELMHRPQLEGAVYADGTRGTVVITPTGRFVAPFRFWKGQPGVYTAAVWVRRPGKEAFIGATACVIVER